MLTNGTINMTGAGVQGSSTATLWVGGAAGEASVNFNSTGTLNLATASGSFYLGGTGANADTGAGAFNLHSGTVNFAAGGIYFSLGNGGPTTYGSFTQSGGTFNILGSSGVRVGQGGYGSWLQTGGPFNPSRYFVVGGNNGAGGSINNGVATFTGGSATETGFYIIVGNLNPSYGVMNIGTEAGGNAIFTETSTGGAQIAQVSGSVGVLNLNSGILQIYGPIITGSGGNGTVNLNGGTIQAPSSDTLMNATPTSINLYNGGLTVNDQNFTNLISGAMLATTGNGIYPVGGLFTVSSGGGSGYLGAPIVTVSGGTGSGALAIATVSNGVVTNVTMTCPGQNYVVGDNLSFSFAAGGTTNPASAFNYTLQAADLAANTSGGLTKIGSGLLTLSGANTYLGSTIVGAGTLAVSVDGGLGQGTVVVAGGATLLLTNGSANSYISPTANVILSATATANLNYIGADTVNGLSTNGGLTFLLPGTYGAAGSGAQFVLTQLVGPGFITATTTAGGQYRGGIRDGLSEPGSGPDKR